MLSLHRKTSHGCFPAMFLFYFLFFWLCFLLVFYIITSLLL
uniref:Uncharacterized protein n=1 Tax=Anguilla anguilla TaxID=7936 RepID=A0A0E9W4T1_ANGAN